MTARWLIVLAAAVALVFTPLAVRAWPAAPSSLVAADLAARVQSSATVAWSGQVESSGRLRVPENDSFANLVQLLGEDNDLRVWWRGPQDWRIDRIRSTGETDLFRNGPYFGASAAGPGLVGCYWALMFLQPQYLQTTSATARWRRAC